MTEMYHFHNGVTLRDGSLVPPIGVRLVHDGPLVICKVGFHASPRIIDALKWAPGNILDGVILSGERIDERDKSVARERTRVWSLDAEALLREFLRDCRAHGVGCVRIVHGKGRNSEERLPVLKNLVDRVLRHRADVLAFHSPPAAQGGSGAVLVLLEKR